MRLRDAQPADVGGLARIWHDGWQDAHADILPEALKRLRTLESFEAQLRSSLDRTRVAESSGAPVGFCIVKGDELYQLYVSSRARGTGAAAALVADAEARMAAAGVGTAWLACAIGNERAERFYEKCGWWRIGAVVIRVDTTAGPFELEVWRYEKPLTPET